MGNGHTNRDAQKGTNNPRLGNYNLDARGEQRMTNGPVGGACELGAMTGRGELGAVARETEETSAIKRQNMSEAT